MLDEHVVFEHPDLDPSVLRTHNHHAVDGLPARQELGFGYDGAAAARFAPVTTALLLGFETGRPLDPLRLGDHFSLTLTRSVRPVVLAGLSPTAATIAAPR